MLNSARDPLGRTVPWPSDRLTGLAQARLLTAGVQAENEDTGSVHSCQVVVGCGLFGEERKYFGTRVMLGLTLVKLRFFTWIVMRAS